MLTLNAAAVQVLHAAYKASYEDEIVKMPCETCLTLGAAGLKPVFWEVMEQSRARRRWWTESRHSACSCSPASATSASAALRTAACQAPQSKGFSRQGYWSGLPCASPWNLPNPGIERVCPA